MNRIYHLPTYDFRELELAKKKAAERRWLWINPSEQCLGPEWKELKTKVGQMIEKDPALKKFMEALNKVIKWKSLS